MSVFRMTGRCLVVGLWVSCVPTAAAELQPFEEWVPEDALAFVSARSVADMESWLEKSPLYDLWRGEDLQPFVRELTELIEKARRDEVGNAQPAGRANEFLELCRGEIALVVARPGKNGGPAQIAVLMDLRGNREKAQELIRTIMEKGADDGTLRMREREFRGDRLVVVERRSDRETEDSPEEIVAYAMVDDSLVIGTGSAFVEQILVSRAEESRPTLADDPDYRYLRDRWGSRAAVLLYFNSEAFFRVLPEIVGETDPDELRATDQALEILGLKGIRRIAMSLILTEASIDAHAFFLVPGAPRGLVKVLWTKPRALRFPPIVPEDASSALLLDLDFEALYDATADLVRLASAGEGQRESGQQDPIRAIEEQLELSFRRDLVEALTGRVLEYERVTGDPSELLTTQGVFLFELRNRERFQSTLERLLGLVPFLFKKSAYLGRPVYSLNLGLDAGAPDEGEEDAMGQTPALGITDTHFVFGVSRGLVEEAIRRVGQETSSLTDSRNFKDVAGELPAATNLLAYQSSDVIRSIIDLLRSTASEEDQATFQLEELESDLLGNDEFGPGFDEDEDVLVLEAAQDDAILRLFRALPKGSAVSRYFRGVLSYGVVDERGFGYTSRTLLKKN